MKILTIESPQMLKDGTVKAAVTVTEDDYIPLISLLKDARRGAEIELNIKKDDNEPEHDGIYEFAQRQAKDLDERLRIEREIGKQEGYEKGLEEGANFQILTPMTITPEVIFESPERQADVVKAHDLMAGKLYGNPDNDRY